MAHLEDDIRPDYWPEPKITTNANMLAGFLIGCLGTHRTFRAVAIDHPFEIISDHGNLFRVTIEQIAGTE